MLFLVGANGSLRWCDHSAFSLFPIVRESGADLARLDWQPSERGVWDATSLRLALRHGVACSLGLVVDAGTVLEQERAAGIRRAYREAAQAQVALEPHNVAMERLFPGWVAYGRELDVGIAESSEDAAMEAEEDAATDLAAPVDPALVEHWQSLGGRLPSPV